MHIVNTSDFVNDDHPWDNLHSLHLIMVVKILVLKFLISVTSFACVKLTLFSRTELSNPLILIVYLEICLMLDSGDFLRVHINFDPA